MDTGSRTIDPGQIITIGYNDCDGFYATRDVLRLLQRRLPATVSGLAAEH